MRDKIFSILLLFLLEWPAYSIVDMHGEALVSQNGLSNNSVTEIVTDAEGFLWIGTRNGLNRYDGSRYKAFFKVPGDSLSLSGNEVKSLYVDSEDNLWVGTSGGLSLYNPSSESFHNFHHSPFDKSTLSHNNVSKIVGDKNTIWVSTSNGLNKIDLQSKKLVRIFKKEYGFASDEIQDLAMDGDSALWLAHYSAGIDYWNYTEGYVLHFGKSEPHAFTLPADNPESILLTDDHELWAGFETGELQSISIDSKGNIKNKAVYHGLEEANIISINQGQDKIFVCTDQSGLLIFKNGSAPKHVSVSEGYLLSNDKIWAAHEDGKGSIFIAHYRGGVTKLDAEFALRMSSVHMPDPNSNAQIITSIAQIGDNEIWVGSDGHGIFSFDRDLNLIDNEWAGLFKKLAVLSIATRGQEIWVGTYRKGVALLKNNQTPVFYTNKNTGYKIRPSGDDIRDIVVDDTVIWFCDHANYLHKYNTENKQFSHYVLDRFDSDLGITYPSPWCLANFSETSLAVGTNRGLLFFDKKTGALRNIAQGTDDVEGISSNSVRTLYKLNTDSLIIGTENGCDIYRPSDNSIVHISDKLFPGLFICGVIQDKENNIWISTKRGLVKTDAKFEESQWFDTSDGLYSSEFVENSIELLQDGRILLGSSEGVIVVDPAHLVLNAHKPRLVFTDLFLNYDRQEITPRGILNQSINKIDTLYIPYKYKALAVAFSSLNYVQSHKNKYSFKLDGFDPRWQPYSLAKRASYTNLEPGEYVLNVKTINNDGYESQIKRLTIFIVPPFYMTIWFRLLIILVVISIIFLLFWMRTRRIQQNNAFLQQHNLRLSKEIVERKVAEKQLIKAKDDAESANRAKSEFLANMSHEIRTPLNAVHGFCEVLSTTDLDGDQNRYIDSIRIASNGLLTLINDLLDLSKIEAGQLEIKPSALQLHNFILDMKQMFIYMCQQKGLELIVDIDPDVPGIITIDISRLRQILVNLLGNAVKFTDRGYVRLQVAAERKKENRYALRFMVADSGIGIKQDDLEKIFNSFSQIESSSTRKYEGTGLGLAICKKMAEMMSGSISAVSEIGKGSLFTVSFDDIVAEDSASIIVDDPDGEAVAAGRAMIIAPVYEQLERLSEVLIASSYDVSVFGLHDFDYVISIATAEDVIFIFNPEKTKVEQLKAEAVRFIVVSSEEGFSDSGVLVLKIPFSSDEIKSVMELVTSETFEPKMERQSSQNSDGNFLKPWLEEIEENSQIFDVEKLSESAAILMKRGKETGNTDFIKYADELRVAVDGFDLKTVARIIVELRKL